MLIADKGQSYAGTKTATSLPLSINNLDNPRVEINWSVKVKKAINNRNRMDFV